MTPEAELLLALTKVPEDGHGEPISSPPMSEKQWNRFGQLAAQHRVEGLVARRLLDQSQIPVPERVSGRLKKGVHGNKVRAIAGLNEFHRISTACEARGIRVLPVKGIDLVQRLYVDPGDRAFLDLDLLVQPAHARSAIDTLRELGYVPPPASAPLRWVRAYHFHQPLLHPETRTVVEVHWALTDAGSSRFSDPDFVWSRTENGSAYPVLRDADYACYLAVHIAKHGVLNERLATHPRGAELALHPHAELKLVWFHDVGLLMRDRALSQEDVLAAADEFTCLREVQVVFAVMDRLWPPRTGAVPHLGQGPREGRLEAKLKDWLVAGALAEVDGGEDFRSKLPWILRMNKQLHFRPVRILLRGSSRRGGP